MPKTSFSDHQPPQSLLTEHSIRALAASYGVDYTTLRARAKISLLDPSIRTHAEATTKLAFDAQFLRNSRAAVTEYFASSKGSVHSDELSETKLVQLPEETGVAIASAVHYLASARQLAQHFGLLDLRSGRLLAYASINSLDWGLITEGMRPIADLETGLLSISRVYATRAAPRNTISRTLSLIIKHYAAIGVRAVVTTAVDQNLGFSGASYLACGWSHIFSVPHLGYLYVDGFFRTRRQLIRTYGTDEMTVLEARLGSRLTSSGPLLGDTLIFATGTSLELRRRLQVLEPRKLCRSRLAVQ